MNNQSTSNEQEDEQGNEDENSYGSRGDDMLENEHEQANEQAMNNQSTSNEQEDEQLISITALINSIININKTLKE